MPALTRAASWLVQRLKHDPSYIVDSRLGGRDLATELADRAVSLARAQWALRGVDGGRIRFVERGCTVRHRRHCRIGAGSVLEAYSRLHCLSTVGVRIGDRVTVGRFAVVECTGVLWSLGSGFRIGDDSAIGDYSFIGAAGGVEVGSRVLMGQRVSIHSENHRFESAEVAIRAQGTTRQGVKIGDDCWIGSGTIILDGVELGQGCVVAAGAVVTRPFPSGSVLGGVPARLMRTREAAGEGGGDRGAGGTNGSSEARA